MSSTIIPTCFTFSPSLIVDLSPMLYLVLAVLMTKPLLALLDDGVSRCYDYANGDMCVYF